VKQDNNPTGQDARNAGPRQICDCGNLLPLCSHDEECMHIDLAAPAAKPERRKGERRTASPEAQARFMRWNYSRRHHQADRRKPGDKP